jgi:hypothetical protein
MRKYLLPSILILALAAVPGIAQIINKALQLSQDATGAFGVDTNNNVYFPGHILSTGPGVPVLTSCGTTPSILGTDTAGQVTTGTTAGGCVVTFNRAYVATPWCVISWQTTPPTTQSNTPSTTAITILNTTQSSGKFNYICSGSS